MTHLLFNSRYAWIFPYPLLFCFFCVSKLIKILILGDKAVKAVDQFGIGGKLRTQQEFYGYI